MCYALHCSIVTVTAPGNYRGCQVGMQDIRIRILYNATDIMLLYGHSFHAAGSEAQWLEADRFPFQVAAILLRGILWVSIPMSSSSLILCIK